MTQLLLSLLLLVPVAAPPPGRVCAITSHGATTASPNNTAAIRAALAACAGGGTVVVAGGAFKTGPLVITGSGITLEVQAGATLEAAFGPADWPLLPPGGDLVTFDEEHKPCSNPPCKGQYQDFLVFQSCDSCGLIGGGVIFGKGGRPPSGFDWYIPTPGNIRR